MIDPATIQIRGEPVSATKCKFVVNRPVYENQAHYFANQDSAKGSPLAEALFAIPGISNVLVSHDAITIGKSTSDDWPALGKAIGAAIRSTIASGQEVVSRDLRSSLPPAEVLRSRVEEVLRSQVNPYVAAHGGVVRLIDVRDNTAFLQMGGGCQGCGMANVTLRQGVEVAIRAAVPEIGDILDTTDHAAGRNPYYAPSGH
ncbi:MAG: thioredoxin [Planctomycetes bacterium]|nr:thioredoxin [Planctomycetota bacterium]